MTAKLPKIYTPPTPKANQIFTEKFSDDGVWCLYMHKRYGQQLTREEDEDER